MFEDVNIKSFKEYIAEQELLKENNELKTQAELAKEGSLTDRINKEPDGTTGAAGSTDAAASNTDAASNAPAAGDKNKKVATTDDLNYTPSHSLSVIDSGFTTNPEGDSPTAQFQDLKNKLKVIDDTYKFLETGEINEVDDFKSTKYKEGNVNKTPNGQNFLPLDVTNGTSLAKYEESFKITWKKNIESWRETHKNVQRIDKLSTPWWNPAGWSVEKKRKIANELVRSKEAGGITPEALKRYIDYIEQNKLTEKEAQEIEKITGKKIESEKPAEKPAEKTETTEDIEYAGNIIDERAIDVVKAAGQRIWQGIKNTPSTIANIATSNPLRTGRDLASGYGNKYNAKNIFTTAKRSKEGRREDSEDEVKGGLGNAFNKQKAGIYGIDKEFFNSMKAKYVRNANNIVSKELGFARPFITKAKGMIDDREKRNKFVGSDVKYLQTLSGELNGALKALYKVGTLLKQNALNYKKALDELLYEYEATEKKTERKMKSLDAETAVEKTLGKIRTSDAKAQEKAEKKAEAQKVKDEQLKQQQDDDLKKNLTKEMAKSAVSAFTEKARAIGRKDFSYKNLEEYLKDITEPSKLPKAYTSNRVNLDGKEHNLEALKLKELKSLANALATVIMFEMIDKKDQNALFGGKFDNFINSNFDDIYDNYKNEGGNGASIIEDVKKLLRRKTMSPYDLAKEKAEARRARKEARHERKKNKINARRAYKSISASPKDNTPKKEPNPNEGSESAENTAAKDFEGEEPQSIYQLAVSRVKKAENK